MKEFEETPERWLDVRWDMDERTPQRFPARIAMQSVNEPGTLAQIAQVIAEHDGNIDNIRMKRRSPDFTDCTIDLEVYDLKHLNADHRAVARQEGGGRGRAGERVTAAALTTMIGQDVPRVPHLRLGVNIDHVATIRNARGGRHPDPVRAAKLAIEAGADGITAHLREDRRHISDDDIARLKAEIDKPLNLEMAATAEMIEIALRDPAARRLPRARAARRAHHRRRPRRRRPARPSLRPVIAALRAAGIRVSLFIAADPQADRDRGGARRAGDRDPHRRLVRRAVRRRQGGGRGRMAAHPRGREARAQASASKCMPATGSITPAPRRSRRLPEIVELNIGHFLIGEAVFAGLAASGQGDARRDGSRPRQGREPHERS